MRHLVAGLVALGLFTFGLVGGSAYARRAEDRSIHALASSLFASPVEGDTLSPELSQEVEGSALQAAALEQPDLLPIYGSSELLWRESQGEFNGSQLFREYPTGFAIFPVSKPGTPALVVLQDLASVGADLRGRKVAISLSPSWLMHRPSDLDAFYAGSFSRLHAGELAFSTDLDPDLKREAAERMLQYPATLDSDPLLRFGLERLADLSPFSRLLYCAVLPLGKLQNEVLRLQDHWATLALIRERRDLAPDVPRNASALSWSRFQGLADQMAKLFEPRWARRTVPEPEPGLDAEVPPREEELLKMVHDSPSWTDLDLLMRGLEELGARPLILSQPLPGAYFDERGVGQAARDAYHARFRETIRPYDLPMVDFAEHDEDRTFVADSLSHLSARGWLYYDEVLDDFYHRGSG